MKSLARDGATCTSCALGYDLQLGFWKLNVWLWRMVFQDDFFPSWIKLTFSIQRVQAVPVCEEKLLRLFVFHSEIYNSMIYGSSESSKAKPLM